MAFQARLLSALSDPDLSLRDVADRLSLPLDQLCLVLTRPDLAQEVAGLESLAATRIRLLATSFLPAAANSARKVLDDFNSPEPRCTAAAALRAIRVLMRLANFASGPVQPRPASARPSHSASALTNPARPAAPFVQTPISSPTRAGETPVALPPFSPAPASPPSVNTPNRMQSNAPHAAIEIESVMPAVPESVHPACDHSPQIHSAPENEESLSPEQAIARAAEMIRAGAFTREQLGDIYRLAAEDSGIAPEDFDPAPEAQDAYFANFLALAENLGGPQESPSLEGSRDVISTQAQSEVDELACAPP